MKIRNIINLLFLAWVLSSLFHIQAMQTNQKENHQMSKGITSRQDSYNKLNLKDSSKEKLKKLANWAKKNKTFLIVFGVMATTFATTIIAKKLREHRGEQALKEDYYDISPSVLRTTLASKYPELKIYKIQNNPFDMVKNKKLNEFLGQRNLLDKPVEIGRSQAEFGPGTFKYNYIKVDNNLFFYPKK